MNLIVKERDLAGQTMQGLPNNHADSAVHEIIIHLSVEMEKFRLCATMYYVVRDF